MPRVVRVASVVTLTCALLATGCSRASKQQPVQEGETHKAQQTAWLFEQKRKCFEIGRQHSAIVERLRGPGWETVRAEYCYSQALNTCLFFSREILATNKELLASTDYIDDALTNERFMTYYYDTRGSSFSDDPKRKAEYQTTETELRAGCAK